MIRESFLEGTLCSLQHVRRILCPVFPYYLPLILVLSLTLPIVAAGVTQAHLDKTGVHNPKTGSMAVNTITRITVAVPLDTPPFFFQDDNTQDSTMKGVVPDLWLKWSEKTGIAVEFKPGTWSQTLHWIQDGSVDAHAGLVFNEERGKFIDFLVPIIDTSLAVFVHPSLTGISSISELGGFLVGVVEGSYSETYLRKHLPASILVTFPDAKSMFAAAGRNEIRAFSRSIKNARWGMSKAGLAVPFVTQPGLVIDRREIIIGLPKGRPMLAGLITEGMGRVTDEERRNIETRWIGEGKVGDSNTLVIAMHHDMPPLSFVDLEGRPVGLLVDIWQRWSEKTGKKIKFLPSPWVTTLNNLKTGKANIHAGLFYSEGRAKEYSFSQAYYESDASFFYQVNTSKISHMEDLNGQKVGAVHKTFHETYLKKNYPKIEVIPFKSTRHMVDAIENGNIQAFFAVPYLASRILSTMGLSGRYDRMDERHGRQKFRAAVIRDNNELLQQVDRGFSQITDDELATLEERWIPNPDERVFTPGRKEIRFTLSEEEWLRDNPVWNIDIGLSQAPYLINQDRENPSGIIMDYLDLISNRLGVIFHTNTSQSPVNKERTLYLGIEKPQQKPERKFSLPLMPVPYVVVNRADAPFITGTNDLSGRTVAAVKSSAPFNHLHSAFPNIDAVPVENQLEALLKTSGGDTYATVCDANIAGQLIFDGRLANLKIAAPFLAPEVSLHFSTTGDDIVLSMLNKAISSITLEEHEQIKTRWNPVRYEKGTNWRLIILWVSGVTLFFLLVLTHFLLLNHRLSREVEERKKIESALLDSEERYRGIFEFTRSGVMVFTAVEDGRDFLVTEFNRSAEKIEKLKKQDVIGKSLTEVFPGFTNHVIGDRLQQVYTTGTPQRLPLFLYRDDRISGWRDYFVYKLPSSELVTVYNDETKRKEDEEAKERLTRQLHQARKLETIGTLAGGVAHDFNNLLAIILGNLELSATYTRKDKLLEKRIKEAHQACLRAKDVIHQLLRFSRGTEEKMEVLNMGELLKESGQLVRSTLPSSIEVQFTVNAQRPLVRGNITQIQQVLLNLCTNAAHAMENTGGILSVTLTDSMLDSPASIKDINPLPPGPYLELRVSDTGQGMDPEIQERIFDPYFTTKEVGKGTGMGLAIAEGVIRSHKGIISVESKPNHGTTFTILLPSYTGELTESSLLQSSEERHTGSERILFIDDEPMIAQLGKDILQSRGYSVHAENNPVKALKLFQRNPAAFDLIITDMTMPEMAGDKLVADILAANPFMPVIICTGYSEAINSEKANAIGALGYVEKPLTIDQLTETVRKVLDRPPHKPN